MVLNLKVLYIGENLREVSGLTAFFSSHTYKDVSTKAQCTLIIGGVGLGLGLFSTKGSEVTNGGIGENKSMSIL